MRIINKTKNITLAQDAAVAGAPFARMTGLLGRDNFKPGEALIIKPCNSIHTFFMRFAIDVLFIDKDNKVIAIIKALKPFRISPVYFKSASVIELPANTLEATLTSLGDILTFEG